MTVKVRSLLRTFQECSGFWLTKIYCLGFVAKADGPNHISVVRSLSGNEIMKWNPCWPHGLQLRAHWQTALWSTKPRWLLPLTAVLFLALYVWMFCLQLCWCNKCVSGTCRSKKRVLDSQNLELYIVVSCCVGSGSQTWITRMLISIVLPE